MRSCNSEVGSHEGAEVPLITVNAGPDLGSTRDSRENEGRSHAVSDLGKSDSSSSTSASQFVWILTCVAGISGLLFGYDTGVISATMVSLGSDLSGRPLTTLDMSLITSCTSLAALVASPIAGVMADRWGRKFVILLADVLFVVGAFFQTAANQVWTMIMGRSILGVAIGAASFTAPLYISELSPSYIRGRMVTVSLLFVTGGQVVAYLIGWLFSTVAAGWRWMVGLGAVPAFIQFTMLSLFMPETPRWLMKAGRQDGARRVLEKIYCRGPESMAENVVALTLRSIEAEIRREAAIEERQKAEARELMREGTRLPSRLFVGKARLPSSIFLRCQALLSQPNNASALTIACLLQALQQLCGFNSLMYFSATIFAFLGFASPTLTSLSIAVTNFVATNIAFHLIDRLGRRRMLLYTIPGMVMALCVCAAGFGCIDVPFDPHAHPPPLPSSSPSLSSSLLPAGRNLTSFSLTSIPTSIRITTIIPSFFSSFCSSYTLLISLLFYVLFYALGIGPIPWHQSELFSLSVRSLGSSIATSVNWFFNFLVGLTFLPMMQYFTPFWTLIGYAGLCSVGWVWVRRSYPERTGWKLEDVGWADCENGGLEADVAAFDEEEAVSRPLNDSVLYHGSEEE